MGLYYIVACHDCRVQSMLPKCPESQAVISHSEWSGGAHSGHNTELSHDLDEYFEAVLMGREVIENGYYGLVTKRVAEPYRREEFTG